jgi:hypothetical protein
MKNYIYISVLALSSISSSALSQRVSQQANASVRISWQSRQPQRPSYPPNDCDHRYRNQPNHQCSQSCDWRNGRDQQNNRYENNHPCEHHRGRGGAYPQGYNQRYMRGLSDQGLNGLVSQLRRSNFDSDKLMIAKQAIHSQGVYADQVLRIMREFSFESSRLEFAQFAYNQCLDPENYYLVNDGFQFSSSVRELNDFIY